MEMNRQKYKNWLIFLLITAGFFSPLIRAQKKEIPAPANAIPADGRPADQRAFQEATRIIDPQKKLAALDAFIASYPKSSSVKSAHQEVLNILIQKQPDQKAKILQRAKKLLAGTTGSSRGRYCNVVASALVDAGIYLDTAVKYGKKALKATSRKKYLSEQRADYLKRKQTAPSEKSLMERYRTAQSSYRATLGRIYLKQGKTGEAEKWLKEAYRDNNNLDSPSLVALAELMQKKGLKAEAWNYLVKARLSGRMSPEGRRQLADLYREEHQGSLDGLEEALDAEYDRLYPNPIRYEKYRPTASRSDRVVLAELYTGAGCPPCAGADLAFDAALERYHRQELAVVVYHLHVPRPDPMTNPDTVARGKQAQVRGTPSYAIDGKLSSGGGGGRDESSQFFEERLRKKIDQRLEEPAEARLSLEAAMNGKIVKVKSAVQDLKIPSSDLQLRIALVENHIRYSGENGIRYHAMVVRSMAGYKVENSPSATIEHSFDLDKIQKGLKDYLDKFENENERFGKFSFSEKKDRIHPEKLAVVAFLEDEKAKTVLQAVHLGLLSKTEGKSEE